MSGVQKQKVRKKNMKIKIRGIWFALIKGFGFSKVIKG